MKKLLAFILTVTTFSLFIVTPVLAVNTHSVLLNGTNQSLTRTDAACETAGSGNCALDLPGNFSQEYWLKPKTAPSAGSHNIVNKYQSGNNSYWINYNFNSGQLHLQVGVSNGSSNATTRTAYTFVLNEWTHFVWLYNSTSGNVQLWLASSSQNHFKLADYASGITGGHSDNTGSFRLGEFVGDEWDGGYDDVRIYTGLLTEAEMNAGFEQDIPSNFTGDTAVLVARWKMDGGSDANGLLDEVGPNDNPFVNNNSATWPADPAWSDAVAVIIPKRPGIIWFD